jgi:ferredoxin-NADP reductase
MAVKFVKGKLVERIQRTLEVRSFRFLCEDKIDFIPGQFLKVFFDENDRNNNNLNKYLSFSSSPTKQHIEVTKKISGSDFSQRLTGLNIGDEVLFQAPLGKCVFKDDYKRIGFLIGGIGITPVISILEYVIDKSINTDVVLFYANKTEEDIAFKVELDNWQKKFKNIKVVYFLEDNSQKKEGYIGGVIDKKVLDDNFKDIKTRVIFSFGPPAMVKVMRDLCLESGCREENIKAESFLGY